MWYAFFHTFNYTSWLYVVIYLLLILAFNYFYVAIQYNPCLLYTSASPLWVSRLASIISAPIS